MPKLDLSKTAVLTQEERSQFKNAQDMIDEVKSKAEEMGLHKYPKPSSQPVSLADMDISELPNAQLGQLYSQYTAHAQWVFQEYTEAEIAYKNGVASLKLLDAKLKAKMFAMGIVKAEVPALMREDPVRVEYEMEVLKLYAMKEILGAHYKAYSKQADALSRIVEIRKLEFEQTIRASGIAGHRKGQPPRPQRDFSRG